MNKWFVSGRLTKEPSEKMTSTGNRMATINVAVDRRDGTKETDFFGFVAWGKIADYILSNLHKGYLVNIIATKKNNNYTRNDGTKVYQDQNIIESLENCERKQQQGQTENTESFYPNDFDGEGGIPF